MMKLQPKMSVRDFIDRFFETFPDQSFHTIACNALDILQKKQTSFPGKTGGWAGGLIYGLLTWTNFRGRHVILNSQLEQIFGVSAATIRKRAELIWQHIVDENIPVLSLRDEANTICAFAFRNGMIEDIHASVDSDGRARITDEEMKRLMIEASGKLEHVLRQMRESPVDYQSFLVKYHRNYCRGWER